MTKNLREFKDIKESIIVTDKQLLDFMKFRNTYTTNDLQKFLTINHTATLQRLKKLHIRGFLDLINERIYRWRKLKNMEDKPIKNTFY